MSPNQWYMCSNYQTAQQIAGLIQEAITAAGLANTDTDPVRLIDGTIAPAGDNQEVAVAPPLTAPYDPMAVSSWEVKGTLLLADGKTTVPLQETCGDLILRSVKFTDPDKNYNVVGEGESATKVAAPAPLVIVVTDPEGSPVIDVVWGSPYPS